MTIDFKEIDELDAKSEFQSCANKLKVALEREPQNAEVLWRMARAIHNQLMLVEKKNSTRRSLISDAYKHATAAYAIAPANFQVVKWLAITTGSVCDIADAKEKIKLGFDFKFLDQALAINSNDSTLLHMRGSWIERKTAQLVLPDMPTGTVDEALKDFLEAQKLRPNWSENLLYIGLCYEAKKDATNAQEYFKKAAEVPSTNVNETDAISIAKKHVKSSSK
ncbi:Regulator of microtubule dynamics protein 1 [Aphelenchoides besseyi]|nr:Regulator of microtubule dynamics protein 1 [Aphelenchoides besseyi]